MKKSILILFIISVGYTDEASALPSRAQGNLAPARDYTLCLQKARQSPLQIEQKKVCLNEFEEEVQGLDAQEKQLNIQQVRKATLGSVISEGFSKS